MLNVDSKETLSCPAFTMHVITIGDLKLQARCFCHLSCCTLHSRLYLRIVYLAQKEHGVRSSLIVWSFTEGLKQYLPHLFHRQFL